MSEQTGVFIYQSEDDSAITEVRLVAETFWLSLNQMAELFGSDKSVISRHLRNVFKERELTREATVAKNATVQKEGEREVVREIDCFNLDVILSVGEDEAKGLLKVIADYAYALTTVCFIAPMAASVSLTMHW